MTLSRRISAGLAVALAAGALASGADAQRRLPGAPALRVCAAAGPYWPTMTLAFAGNSAWIACKEQYRLDRVDLATGRTAASVGLTATPIAVASGYGSIWALDSNGMLYRLDPAGGGVTKQVDVLASAAYNVWIGGGSVWVADDRGASVIRVSPRTNAVVARLRVGNGPADMAFGGTKAWVIDHRDRSLFAIDLRTNRASQLATVPGDAPERMVLLGGSLWITGRGTDLVEIDPATGTVRSATDIGASGIDLVATPGAVWVPARNAAVDPTGFPTMDALRRVAIPTRRVTTVARAAGRLDVHGLEAHDGAVWLADTRDGALYRVPA